MEVMVHILEIDFYLYLATYEMHEDIGDLSQLSSNHPVASLRKAIQEI